MTFRVDEEGIANAQRAVLKAASDQLLDPVEIVVALAAATGIACGHVPGQIGDKLAALGNAITALSRAFNITQGKDSQ